MLQNSRFEKPKKLFFLALGLTSKRISLPSAGVIKFICLDLYYHRKVFAMRMLLNIVHEKSLLILILSMYPQDR